MIRRHQAEGIVPDRASCTSKALPAEFAATGAMLNDFLKLVPWDVAVEKSSLAGRTEAQIMISLPPATAGVWCRVRHGAVGHRR